MTSRQFLISWYIMMINIYKIIYMMIWWYDDIYNDIYDDMMIYIMIIYNHDICSFFTSRFEQGSSI